MSMAFDRGYSDEPFVTLCREYPDASVYPPDDFRVEWGPVFHRGRLDGSARILVIGQDPAASEAIVRRILVGAAGQRVQGFLAKLGILTSYAMVNAFLYSAYGQRGAERHRKNPAIAAYRERWLDALVGPNLEAVVAFGGLANEAWRRYRERVGGRAAELAYAHARHPTWPESSAGADPARLAKATAALLANWNAALERLAPAMSQPDVPGPDQRYGSGWQEGDLREIPPDDLPPGLPNWMRSLDPWARRDGATASEKRATIAVTVPVAARAPAILHPAATVHAVTAASLAAAPTSLADREAETEDVAIDADPLDGLAASAHPEAAQGGRAAALVSPRWALRGRVVTMEGGRVIEDGVVWVAHGLIEAVEPAGAPPPAGFSSVEPVPVNGAIFPGFIDLHNHLAYDVLPAWRVPKRYANRDQWKRHAEYDQLVKRPMSILGRRADMLPAICRYVECKALFGGTTTTQGIRLVSAGGITKYFRGIVRNVEMPDDPELAGAESRMADVASRDRDAFWKTLQAQDAGGAAYLLHLSEGTDARARQHFLALRSEAGEWAVNRALAGIHCVALGEKDFALLEAKGASMVWSPMSNLLLYGETADVRAAARARLRIGLGCDWSPSGSKNLLGEMKVAWLLGRRRKAFDAERVVRMVTSDAAEIVRWSARVGTLARGKVADLTVLEASEGDPYEGAVRATERDVLLVVVGGAPRYGSPDLMRRLVVPGKDTEDVLVAGALRTIDLESSDPRVPAIRFSEARAILSDALRDLPRLEQDGETGLTRALALRPFAAAARGWTLALDEIEPTGVSLHPRLPLRGRSTGPAEAMAAPAKKLPTVPVSLDPPTIADDPGFLEMLGEQKNLPRSVRAALRKMYAPA